MLYILYLLHTTIIEAEVGLRELFVEGMRFDNSVFPKVSGRPKIMIEVDGGGLS